MNSRVNKLAIIAVVVCSVALAAFLGAAIWQRTVHDSNLDDAHTHFTVAAVIEKAEAEGTQAGNLLQQYVASGDASLIPQIQTQTSQGVSDLTSAVRQSGGDSNGFLDKGTQFVQASGQIIAARQSGDAKAASAAVTQLGQQFQDFIAAQTQFATREQSMGQANLDSADSAGAAESWLFLAAGLSGIGGMAAGLITLRSRSRRRSLTGATTAQPANH